MKKRIVLLASTLVILSSGLVGCQTTSNGNDKENVVTEGQQEQGTNENGILYSNLQDEATQKEVADILLAAGVSEEHVATFLDWVKEMNDNIKTAPSMQDGFQYAGADQITYDDVELKQELDENGDFVTDMNCRLTAYLLFNQFVQVNNLQEDYDSYLMFDIEALENEERFASIRDEESKFTTLFNPVAVEEGTTVDDHVKAIQKAWEERGISFEDNEKISLINLYLHMKEDNLRFIGHTGVLVEQEDGLLFIEKYGWNKPFQATKFQNEDELIKYVLGRGDLVGDGTEEPVIVMKNDQVISK